MTVLQSQQHRYRVAVAIVSINGTVADSTITDGQAILA